MKRLADMTADEIKESQATGVDREGNIVGFTAQKSDAQIAQEIRDEMAPHLAALCKCLDKARAHGMQAQFNLLPDSFGRHNPPFVIITKAL